MFQLELLSVSITDSGFFFFFLGSFPSLFYFLEGEDVYDSALSLLPRLRLAVPMQD